MVSDGFTAPWEAKFVRFECSSNVATTSGFTCKTKSQGEFRIKGEFSKSKHKTIDVPIVASGTFVNIYFSTTDSNGGFVNWELKY